MDSTRCQDINECENLDEDRQCEHRCVNDRGRSVQCYIFNIANTAQFLFFNIAVFLFDTVDIAIAISLISTVCNFIDCLFLNILGLH